MLHCNRGQVDFQRCGWVAKYEIAGQKAVDAWLDVTTPRPVAEHHAVQAEVERLREVARARLCAKARQT